MREYETVAHEAALRDIQGVDIKTGEAVEEESPDAVSGWSSPLLRAPRGGAAIAAVAYRFRT